MALDRQRTRAVFAKLDHNLGKLSGKPTPKNIHQFRTYSRRLQALLEELVPELSRNDRKVHKLVSRLRKRVGRIRDLDAQISALRTLKLPDKAGSKSELLGLLTDSRARRERRLVKLFDRDTVRELRKRLKRTARTVAIPVNTEPLKVATRLLAQAEDNAPWTEERLHQYRILVKRARYLVEFAATTPDSENVLEQLKRMQDALGDWHDWLTLTDTAEERFGTVHDSALVAALHNLTRARFRRAVEVVMQTRTTMLQKPPIEPVPQRVPATVRETPLSAIA